MKINVEAVLDREAKRKAEVKPLPMVKVVPSGNYSPPLGKKVLIKREAVVVKEATIPIAFPVTERDITLQDLWAQLTAIKKDRAKLSTRTYNLVDELHEKLKKESHATATAFMDGELAMPELADHYKKIQAFTDQAIVVWDKIRYVEQYGTLPDPEPAAVIAISTNPDADAIKYEIRRYDDLIHKTKKKLVGPDPKNKSRKAIWHERLALAEVQRDELKRKLKSIQYEARAERPGEE